MILFPPHLCDFYKTGHIFQYPEGITQVYSNLTARSSHHFPIPKEDFDGKVVFLGLQGVVLEFLQELWNKEFFGRDLEYVLDTYKSRMDSSLGPGMNIDHIEALWKLGYLPIEIYALPEGTKVPMRVPMFTIKNTHSDFYWLTNYLETALSAELWKVITVATIAHQYRKLVDKYQEETGGPSWFSDWQCHDFSMRGMSGIHDAAQTSIGHLASFKGTDTIPAIDYIAEYYGSEDMIGGSVPASEHSVMCAGGSETELETFRRLITKIYPNGIISIVSDTWDFWKVLTEIAVELKDEIMAREGKVVFRPDSGDPVDIICGLDIPDYSDHNTLDIATTFCASNIKMTVQEETPHGECGPSEYTQIFSYRGHYYEIEVFLDWNRYDKQYYYLEEYDVLSCEKVDLTPEQKGSISCLWETFGGTTNEKGFKELDSHVGCIYGDSITYQRAKEILERLKKKGFASSNIVFGVGSYSYNLLSRDSLGMAVKSTAIKINDVPVEIFKDPKTDSGTKKSAKGYLKVIRGAGGELELQDQVTEEDSYKGEMRLVFANGTLFKRDTLDTIRSRLMVQV